MTLESVATCPVCSSHRFIPHLTAQDHTTTGETFALVKCTGCELIITTPRPTATDIGRYYESDQYISHTSASTTWFDKAYQKVRSLNLETKQRLIERYQRAGRILDYGCGTGQFFAHMKKKGWTGDAIEPSPPARQRASIETDQPIHANWSTIPSHPYQVITLWHVLEHVHDLPGTLQQLKTHLADTGTLFIAVPNHRAHDANQYQQHWAAYDVPRHLWHFHQTAMQQLLTVHGFRLVEVCPMKWDAYYVSLLSEGYRSPTRSKAVRLLRACHTGWQSNQKATRSGEYSSLIYIATHA